MRSAFLAVWCVTTLFSSAAVAGELWQRVSVPASQTALWALAQHGADLEGLLCLGGRYVFFAEADQVERWGRAGIELTIEDRDVEASNQARLSAEEVPLGGGFATGSMNGYFTYAEVASRIDEYRKKRPSIMSERMSIGTSIEGRSIWALKISDNPSKAENEPKILYTALTHSREPEGMMALMYFVRYIMDRYGEDPEVTWLVNNRELWFIPVVNPDGYVYNETQRPAGGGMWRKNRRENTNSSSGVDLNRNFSFRWGYDDEGSSPIPSDETYRGMGPASEPETATVQAFCRKQKLTVAMNYHAYGNDLINPWGYIDAVPERSHWTRLTTKLTATNYFVAGNSMLTIGYPSNGDSDDWMYGARHTYAMSPEIGTHIDGFWPPHSHIEPLAQLVLPMNLATAWAAGAYATIESNTLTDSSGNGSLSPKEDGTLRVIFANLGVGQKTHALAVRVSSSDSRITITGGGNITITPLAVMARTIKTISLRGGTIPKYGTAILTFEYLEAGAVIRTETLTISVEP